MRFFLFPEFFKMRFFLLTEFFKMRFVLFPKFLRTRFFFPSEFLKMRCCAFLVKLLHNDVIHCIAFLGYKITLVPDVDSTNARVYSPPQQENNKLESSCYDVESNDGPETSCRDFTNSPVFRRHFPFLFHFHCLHPNWNCSVLRKSEK